MKVAVAGALAGLLVLGAGASLAEDFRFEDCLLEPGETASVTVEHAGKTYGLRFEACRTEFLSDPERYAQLYEALVELERSGEKIFETGSASLVPS